MQGIRRTGHNRRVGRTEAVVPEGELETGRIPAADLQAVYRRQGLLGGQQHGQAGVAGRGSRTAQGRHTRMRSKAVPGDGPQGVPHPDQGDVGLLHVGRLPEHLFEAD